MLRVWKELEDGEDAQWYEERWGGQGIQAKQAHLAFCLAVSFLLPALLQTSVWECLLLFLCLPVAVILSPRRSLVIAASLAWPYALGLRLALSASREAFWLAIPLNLGAYAGPPMPRKGRSALPGRVFLALVCLLRCSTVEEALTFALCQFLVLRKTRRIETRECDAFGEQLQHTRRVDAQIAETENTLVRNAMRLAFPENPFHDKATEARVERIRLSLHVSNTTEIGDGLRPANLPVPRHLAIKLRSCKMARYTYQGTANVLVQSVPNLEVLETDTDLEWFMLAVQQAAQLPATISPGLMRTIGFCLSPCTFVVEELIDLHTVTLRDLILELSAENLKLDWYFCRPLLASLAETLSKVHAGGALHRRVSISTVFLTGKQTCVLFPCTFYHAFPEVRKRHWGSSTWDVAPEAKRSPADFCEASDVWAFCVVAWELLVGPFTSHVTPFAMPPSVPKAVVDSIIDGLSPFPDGRPQMEELFELLSRPEITPSEESLVSRPVFVRVLQRLNATPAKPPNAESLRSIKPVATSPSAAVPAATPKASIRVSFVDINQDEEML